MSLDNIAQTIERFAGAVCLLVVAGSAAFAAWDLHQTQITLRQDIPALSPTVARMNKVLDAVDAPCVGFQGSVTCGTLAQLSQTEKNVGLVAAQSALQVKQTGALITAAASTVTEAGVVAQATAKRLGSTADAATGTLTQAQTDLTTLNKALQGVEPVLDRAQDSEQDFDALLKANAVNIDLTLGNVQQITANVAGISLDAKKETDAMVAPKTTGQKIWGYVPSTLKLGAEVTCLIAKVPCP